MPTHIHVYLLCVVSSPQICFKNFHVPTLLLQ
jgi:hypothetical protein